IRRRLVAAAGMEDRGSGAGPGRAGLTRGQLVALAAVSVSVPVAAIGAAEYPAKESAADEAAVAISIPATVAALGRGVEPGRRCEAHHRRSGQRTGHRVVEGRR